MLDSRKRPRGADSANDVQPSPGLLMQTLYALHDHLGMQGELLKQLAEALKANPDGAGFVDIERSVASGTILTLPPVPAPCRITQVLYAIGGTAAAVLTIGRRTIYVQVAAGIPMPQSLDAMPGILLYPQDTVSLAISGASPTAEPMYLELMGTMVSPHDRVTVIQ